SRPSPPEGRARRRRRARGPPAARRGRRAVRPELQRASPSGPWWSRDARRRNLPRAARARRAPLSSAARQESSNGAGPAARPVSARSDRRRYLTVAGMPLILPAFSSVNCAATADLIEAETFGLHLPYPTPLTLASKTASVPPFSLPACAALIAESTAPSP